MNRDDLLPPGDPEFETLILAHADGELLGAEAELAEAMLEAFPEAQALFEETLDQADALAEMFDTGALDMARTAPDLTQEVEAPKDLGGARPVAAPTVQHVARPKVPPRLVERAPRHWLAGIAAAAALACGIWLGYALAPRQAEAPVAQQATPSVTPPVEAAPELPGWRTSVATYQRLYTAATFATAPVSDEAQVQTLSSLSPIFEVDLTTLAVPEGLVLKRVQILQINDRPLAQLAFVAEGGATVSLCIYPRRSEGAPREAVTGTLLDLQTVDWRSTRNAYLLIGDAEDAVMERFARVFVEQLN